MIERISLSQRIRHWLAMLWCWRAVMRFASIFSCLLSLAHGGDVVGKVVTGYQGWLSAPGDGSLSNQWKHTNLECWPDVREYTSTFSGCPFKQAGITQPGFTGNLGNGTPARFFSSWSDQTVNKHFEWMQEYGGIDCVALQRFGSELKSQPLADWKNGIATKVRRAAETYSRKYYIMYDISAWSNFQSEIKNDWNALKGSHLDSPAYAREGGKPVVCIWGMGFSDRPGNAQSWKDVCDWFKAQGCYVIGGLPQRFQSDERSYTDPITAAITTNQEAFKVCDMVMVWIVGRSSGFATLYADGLNWCNTHGKAYQADIYPGSAFYNTDFAEDAKAIKNRQPRKHGDFMWSQFAAAKEVNVDGLYISMFDELQEATQIFKTAENAAMVPDGKYFLTLDADGIACSSDFYLRLTKDGSDMFKGLAPFVTAHPTAHSLFGNLVTNPSFEIGATNPTFWQRAGSAIGTTATSQNGSVSLGIASNGANEPTTQTIPIQNGRSYKLSVWINAAAMTNGTAVFDTSDQYDGAGQGQFVLNAANAGWTKYSGTFIATSSSITLRMFTESSFRGTVYFDNVVLERNNSAPVANPQAVQMNGKGAKKVTLTAIDPEADPLTYKITGTPAHGILSGDAPHVSYTPDEDFTGSDRFTFTTNDGSLGSATATVTLSATPSAPVNLVVNPSFEIGGSAPTTWTRAGSAIGSNESAKDGGNSLKISAAGSNSPTTQAIPLQKGKTYHLSVWINAVGMTAGKAVFDTNDAYDGLGQGQFVMNSANAGWMEYSGKFTATTSSVTVRMFTDRSFSGTVYFDHITLTEAPLVTFNSWIKEYFPDSADASAMGFAADPDNDRLANGLEFVLGGNPILCDSLSFMPTCRYAGDLCLFTFKRSEAAKSGISQIVQYGENLGDWTDVLISANAGSINGATYTVQDGNPASNPDIIEVSIPNYGKDRIFARLKVVQP
jgi:hypothetical protein